jgi:hypothetical protein
VRLLSCDGAMVSLQPAGYQLDRPGGTAGPGTDGDDDDWLMIRGEVRTADGRAWEFTDPCLTAVEAAALAVWLQAAAGQDTVERQSANPATLALACGCDCHFWRVRRSRSETTASPPRASREMPSGS